MNLVKFNKPAQYRTVNHVFDELMNDFFAPSNSAAYYNTNTITPAANVGESEKAFTIEFSVPGYEKENFKVKTEKDVLTISGEVKKSKEEKKTDFNRVEFSIGNFERSFKIPENVDLENISAKYTNGILNVELPKKELEVKKALEINIQ